MKIPLLLISRVLGHEVVGVHFCQRYWEEQAFFAYILSDASQKFKSILAVVYPYHVEPPVSFESKLHPALMNNFFFHPILSFFGIQLDTGRKQCFYVRKAGTLSYDIQRDAGFFSESLSVQRFGLFQKYIGVAVYDKVCRTCIVIGRVCFRDKEFADIVSGV